MRYALRVMHIIVGLGNPGEQYKNSRHNAGFMAVDFLAEKNGLAWKMDKKFNALIIKDGDTIYLKPQTFMNESGISVQAILSYYKLLPKTLGIMTKKESDLSEILTVIHDDLDVDFGKMKESVASRSAGHRGVESIINHLKTKNFKRIRIGIRSPLQRMIPTEKFVLQNFGTEEMGIIDNLIAELNFDKV
jgi:peptidyl-tRNA hydrolase, PTH1 family